MNWHFATLSRLEQQQCPFLQSVWGVNEEQVGRQKDKISYKFFFADAAFRHTRSVRNREQEREECCGVKERKYTRTPKHGAVSERLIGGPTDCVDLISLKRVRHRANKHRHTNSFCTRGVTGTHVEGSGYGPTCSGCGRNALSLSSKLQHLKKHFIKELQ